MSGPLLDAMGGTDAKAVLNSFPDENSIESLSVERKILYRTAVELIRGKYSESDWQAFFRVVVDGQKPKDVAEELNTSVNKVYLAKSRILKHVREEFDLLIRDPGEVENVGNTTD